MSYTPESLAEAMKVFIEAFQDLSIQKVELERMKQEYGAYIAQHFSTSAKAAPNTAPNFPPSAELEAYFQLLLQQAVQNLSATQNQNTGVVQHPGMQADPTELAALKTELETYKQIYGWVPPGHEHFPLPSIETLNAHLRNVRQKPLPPTIAEIDLNVDIQLILLKTFAAFGPDVDFPAQRTDSHRYYAQNDNFPLSDAILLQCMLRHLKPQRVLQIGSGFSSYVMLDTVDRFKLQTRCEFIELFPERLLENMRGNDLGTHGLHAKAFQDVDPSLFASLNPGDILFIDSSHMSKLNSNVNHILFNVLPVLKSGVMIHFHDIFYPFENPPQLYQYPLFWNECYLLHAFLMNNPSYKIMLWNDYLRNFHQAELGQVHAGCQGDTNQSLWLIKQ